MLSFNILPPEIKTKFQLKKRIRIAVIWGVSFFLLLVGFTFLLIPSYFLSSSQQKEVLRNLAVTEESPLMKRIAGIRQAISALKQSAADLERASKNASFFSDTLSDVMQKLPKGVVPTVIQFDAKSRAFTFQGSAVNRAALVALEAQMKSNKRLENVSIPLSDLVQGDEISFSLKAVLRNQ